MTTKTELLKVIRRKCYDCSEGSVSEIAKCPVQRCDLFPFRMGRDPNPARKGKVENLPSVSNCHDA